MVKLQVRTSGKDIIISQDNFEHLLNCLANQKYIPLENLGKIEQENQDAIDDFWRQGMNFLSNGVIASSKVEEPTCEEKPETDIDWDVKCIFGKNALLIAKVGSDDRPATEADIEYIRQALVSLNISNLKLLVTHHNVNFELIDISGLLGDLKIKE